MNEKEIIYQYHERKTVLEALGDWVSIAIVQGLATALGSEKEVEKFLKIPPTPRVKEIDSLIAKVYKKKSPNPFKEITDLVGVRFVVLKLEDVKKVGDIVENYPWDWSKDKDHDKDKLNNPDFFAYQSDHYVVETLTEFEHKGMKIPSGWTCEIQIRTLLQHAYAEMAHDTDYKPSIKLPDDDQKKVRRSLAKGSALIETTDEVFMEISQRLTKYTRSLDELLQKASEIYAEVVGEKPNMPSKLGQMIADYYRHELKNTSPEELENWSKRFDWPDKDIKNKRYSNILFRDPIIVLLCWLVKNHQHTMPDNWPIDITLLEEIYIMLGISTMKLFG